MGEYNGTSSVELYIRRIAQRVNEYGVEEVLSVLPTCMKEDAGEWYEALMPETHEYMMRDINEWIRQLRLRFAKDPLQAEEEASRCRHSFANEKELSLRKYITRKQSLLYEADEGLDDGNQYRMIRKIWQDLDPTLMNAVSIHSTMTLEEFTAECYHQEYAARRQWNEWNNAAKRIERTAREGYPERKPFRKPLGSMPSRGNRLPYDSQRPRYFPQAPAQKALPAPEKPGRLGPFRPCRHCGKDHWDKDCPTHTADKDPNKNTREKDSRRSRVRFAAQFAEDSDADQSGADEDPRSDEEMSQEEEQPPGSEHSMLGSQTEND